MAGKFYKVAAGYTTPGGVADEGQVVREEDMVYGGVEFKPLTEDEQMLKYGRILYEEYTPEEGEVIGTIDQPPPPGDNPIAPKEQADEQRAEFKDRPDMVDQPEEAPKPRSRATVTEPRTTVTPPQHTTRETKNNG